MAINLNNSDEFIKEITIFNDGKAGVVENVKVRIEKKTATAADDKHPVYKLIAADDKGEINEGFYYCEPDSKAFTKYQAQRLIMLARGVLGKDIQFPVFNTPTETLDGIMKMVAPALNKPFRVAAAYGTTKNKSAYIGFKEFGSFIQPMSEANTLKLDASDSLVKGEKPKPTDASTLVSGMTAESNPANLDWMNS